MLRIFFLLQFFCLAILTKPGFAQADIVGQEIIPPDSNKVYRNLNDALKNPEHVFRLDLRNKRFDSIPSSVFLFENLRELNLSRNRIVWISPEIAKLKSLVRLDLSNNRLSSLPNEIGELASLQYLGLNRNVIEELPTGIGGLSSLEILELWDNELRTFPDEMAQLKNLKILELRGILFSEEQQKHIDEIVVRSAKIHMSPSCNCD